MLMDPHPSQQHVGIQHAVLQLQQEVTRPKARFKPTSPKNSGVDGGGEQSGAYISWSVLGRLFNILHSPVVLGLNVILNYCGGGGGGGGLVVRLLHRLLRRH